MGRRDKKGGKAGKPSRAAAAAVDPAVASRGDKLPRWRLAPGCKDDLADLPNAAFSGLTTVMERHLAGKTRVPQHFKPMGDGLYELRYEHSNNHSRLLYFHHQGDLIGLTAFAKNQEKTPRRHLQVASKRLKAWKAAHPSDP